MSADGRGLVSQAGAVLLRETLRVTGLGQGLSRWRAPRAVRDPSEAVADLAADGGLVTVDLDATIVAGHSKKYRARSTWKRTFGFHPMTAWADHGPGGNGEPSRSCSVPGTPTATRPPATSRPLACPWRSCPDTCGGKCSSAPIPPTAPRVPGLADGPVMAALVRRHDDHRRHAGRRRQGPCRCADARLRRRRRDPGRRVGRGHHRSCSDLSSWPGLVRGDRLPRHRIGPPRAHRCSPEACRHPARWPVVSHFDDQDSSSGKVLPASGHISSRLEENSGEIDPADRA